MGAFSPGNMTVFVNVHAAKIGHYPMTHREINPAKVKSELRLVTLTEFLKLSPRSQGYVSYMQSELPGSPLKGHDKNPYLKDSANWVAFNDGQTAAVLEVQDYDD